MGVLLGLGPGSGCHVFDLLVGQYWRLGEHFAQVVLRVDSSTAASFDDREEDGAELSGFGFAYKQPVFLANGSWPDGILDGVVVDLDSAVFEIDGEHGPHRQGVVDGSAHGVLRQVLSFEFDPACCGALSAASTNLRSAWAQHAARVMRPSLRLAKEG